MEGTVYLENMGIWTGPDGSTSYLEVGLGFLNSWYFEDEVFDWKGPSCYIIFFGTSDGTGYDVHIQTQPTKRPTEVLTFPAATLDGVYEPASFIYKMTVNFEEEEIYLWVKHSETGTTDEVAYDFDEFGWDEIYERYGIDPDLDDQLPLVPSKLARGPVFAGMISDDPDAAGHATISAIRVTELI